MTETEVFGKNVPSFVEGSDSAVKEFLTGKEALERLPIDKLEELLEAKKKEAEKKIRELAPVLILIAEWLGKKMPKKHGNLHVFSRDDTSIEWDDYGGNIEVFWRKKTVFCNHPTNKVFRPGKWLEEVKVWEPLARARKEQEEADEKRKELIKKLEKFLPVEK